MKTTLKTRFPEANASPGFLLWKASNLLQRLHASSLKKIGLTPAQFSVLASIVYLSGFDEALTQAYLARHTGLDKMFISDLVKKLVQKKWISLEDHPSDSRAKVIRATSKGTALANESIAVVEEIDAAFFSKLERGEAFSKDLLNLLSQEEIRKK